MDKTPGRLDLLQAEARCSAATLWGSRAEQFKDHVAAPVRQTFMGENGRGEENSLHRGARRGEAIQVG